MTIRKKLTRLTVVATLIAGAVVVGPGRSSGGIRSRSAQIAASRLRANLARRTSSMQLRNQLLRSQQPRIGTRRSTNARLPHFNQNPTHRVMPLLRGTPTLDSRMSPLMYKEGDPVRRNYRMYKEGDPVRRGGYRMYKEGDPVRRGLQLNVQPNIRRPNVRQQYIPWQTIPQNTLH